jgi:hypothetical protein
MAVMADLVPSVVVFLINSPLVIALFEVSERPQSASVERKRSAHSPQNSFPFVKFLPASSTKIYSTDRLADSNSIDAYLSMGAADPVAGERSGMRRLRGAGT